MLTNSYYQFSRLGSAEVGKATRRASGKSAGALLVKARVQMRALRKTVIQM